MFKSKLERLQCRYGERLEVFNVYSPATPATRRVSGHIDRDKLARWFGSTLVPETIDDWFLRGPIELVITARDTLVEHLVDPDRIHVELFHGSDRNDARDEQYPRATVTMRLSDCEQTFDVAPGDSVLEAALLAGANPPYTCAWEAPAAPARRAWSPGASKWTTTSRSVAPNSARATS